MKPTKRYCVSYERFSSTQQQGNDSLRRQSSITNRLCHEFDLILDQRTSDAIRMEGVSAFTGENLERLCDYIDQGLIPKGYVILVEDFDRLTRLPLFQCIPKIDQILTSGIDIIIDAPRMVMTNETKNELCTRLSLCIEVAHMYSEKLAGRVKESWIGRWESARREDRHIVATSIVPYGLRVELQGRQRLAIIDEEAANITKKIFNLAESGSSPNMIARNLNDEDIPSAKGKLWHDSAVVKILHNRAYLGEYQPHKVQRFVAGKKQLRQPTGVPIPDYFPAIITLEQWERTHRALAVRSKASSGKHRNGSSNLLTGICFCHKCKSSMMIVDKGSKSRSVPKLVCTNRHKSKNHCTAKRIDRIIAEASVVHALLKNLNRDRLLQSNGRQKEIEQKQRKLARLSEDIKLRKKDLDEYAKRLSKIKLNNLQAFQDEYERKQASLEKTQQAASSLEFDLSQLTISDDTLIKRRNSISDIAVQAIFGLEGFYIVDGIEYRFWLSDDAPDNVRIDGHHFQTNLMPDSERLETRVRLKIMLSSIIKRVVFQTTTVSITLLNGDTLTTPILDPTCCADDLTIMEAFEGWLMVWFLLHGPKTYRQAALDVWRRDLFSYTHRPLLSAVAAHSFGLYGGRMFPNEYDGTSL